MKNLRVSAQALVLSFIWLVVYLGTSAAIYFPVSREQEIDILLWACNRIAKAMATERNRSTLEILLSTHLAEQIQALFASFR